MRAGRKLIVAFAAASCISLSVGISGLVGLERTRNAALVLNDEVRAPMAGLYKISADFPRLGLALRQAMLAPGKAERAVAADRASLCRASIDGALLARRGDPAYATLTSAWMAYSPLVGKVAVAAAEGDGAVAIELAAAGARASDEVLLALDGLVAMKAAEAEAAYSSGAELSRSATAIAALATALGAIAAAAIGLLLARSFRKNQAREEDVLREIKAILEIETADAPPVPRPSPNAASLPRRGLVLLPRAERRRRAQPSARGLPRLRLLPALSQGATEAE